MKKHGPYSGTTLYSRPVSGEDYFATAGTAYTLYIIDWLDKSPSASTDSFMPRPKRLIIAIDSSHGTATAEMEDFMDQFNNDFGVPFRNVNEA